MIKKNDTKVSSKKKTPAGAAAARRKAKAAEQSAAKDLIEKIEADEPKAAAVETAKEEAPMTETAEAIQKELPEAEAAEAIQEELPEAEAVEPVKEETPAAEAPEAPAPEETYETPRRSVAFIGSECYPFVKTGGLGDVMYALPKALVKQNCDVKVILPRYKCIPWEYQEK